MLMSFLRPMNWGSENATQIPFTPPFLIRTRQGIRPGYQFLRIANRFLGIGHRNMRFQTGNFSGSVRAFKLLKPLENENSGREPLQIIHSHVIELVRNKTNLIGILRQSFGESLKKYIAIRGGEQRRAIIRIPHDILNQSIGRQLGNCISQFKRERPMFIKNEIEASIRLSQLLEDKYGLLNVCFSTPTAPFEQFFRSIDDYC